MFSDLSPGLYAVRAIATSVNGTTGYFPTYYYSTVDWQSASVIGIPNALTVLFDIRLVPTSNANGQGVINGSLIDPDGILAEVYTAHRTAGIGDIQIVLSDGTGQPLRFTYTDAGGEFRFEDLAWGSYRIRFEYPGIQSPEVWVTLGPDLPTVSDVVISTTQLGFTGTTEVMPGKLLVAPQPVIDYCSISVSRAIDGEHTLSIIGTNGQILKNIRNIFSQAEAKTIDVSDLGAGIYVVKVQSDQEIWISKLIKH
jgi:hypothetical protein